MKTKVNKSESIETCADKIEKRENNIIRGFKRAEKIARLQRDLPLLKKKKISYCLIARPDDQAGTIYRGQAGNRN